ncbi:MAG: cupin domain-containing protein [Chitinophagaceae bacterium]
MEKRVFENPLIKDKVTLLESSRETGGAYTLVEVELEAGGGNPLHYHTTFNEEFTALEGVLGVQLGKKQLRLKPGQKALAPVRKFHRFYNPGKEKVKFHVRLIPGNEGFENTLRILYGLAGDGLLSKRGVPKKLDHLAVFAQKADLRGKGLLFLLLPYLRYRAKQAQKRGVYEDLLRKYA